MAATTLGLPFVTVGPSGSGFGPSTPGTTTSGIQEAIDAAASAGGGTVEIMNSGAPYLITSQLVFRQNVNIRGNNATIRNASPSLKEPFVTDGSKIFYATSLQDLTLDGNNASNCDAVPVTGSPFTYTNSSNTPRLVRVTGGRVSSVTVGGLPAPLPPTLKGYYLVPGASNPTPTLVVTFAETPSITLLHPVLTLQGPQKCVLDLSILNPGVTGYCLLWTTNGALASAVTPPAKSSTNNQLNLTMEAAGGGGLVMGGDGEQAHGVFPVTNNTGVLVHAHHCGTFCILQPAWCDSNIIARASCQVNQNGALGIVSNSNGGGLSDVGVYNNRWLNVSVDVAPNRTLESAFQLGRCGSAQETNGKGVWVDQIYSSVGAGGTLSAMYSVLPNNGYLVGTSFCFDSLNNVWWYRGQPGGKYLSPFVTAQVINKSETGADPNLLSFSPPKVAGLYRLHFTHSVKAANAAVIGWTATWTDAAGNAQAPRNLSLFEVGGATPALTFSTPPPAGVQDYYGTLVISVDNSGAPIVIKTTLSGGALTASLASAWVERIA